MRTGGRVVLAWAAVGVAVSVVPGPVSGAVPAAPLAAVPRAECGPGSRPETGLQGRVSAADHASGYSDLPITCNTELLAHHGAAGGFKVERYTDAAGHDCAYYDGTLLFPTNVPDSVGTYVLDMTDPAHPVQTAQLLTLAMLSPHESLLVNKQRGLLAAGWGTATFQPGQIDIYDIAADCRHPELLSSTPTGFLGHESGWSLDGDTYYSTSLVTGHVTAVDVSNPRLPVTLWIAQYASHGMSLNDDGTRAYLAARTGVGDSSNPAGLIILDVSDIQNREPFPAPSVVSDLHWDDVTVPQNAMPVTIDGHPYLVEVDEFTGGPVPDTDPESPAGKARIIDIADETKPFVVSTIGLEVHMPENRVEVLQDPGGNFAAGSYASHYCGVPREVDPVIMACSMILSGLRVFDIRDPYNPREIAYFNSAGMPEAGDPNVNAFAMSRPSFVPERGEIWYSDGNSGFYAVRVTNGVWPGVSDLAPSTPIAPAPAPAPAPDATAPTGAAVPFGLAALLVAAGLAFRRVV